MDEEPNPKILVCEKCGGTQLHFFGTAFPKTIEIIETTCVCYKTLLKPRDTSTNDPVPYNRG